MQDLNDGQLRHLAAVTLRLAALTGRELFLAMQARALAARPRARQNAAEIRALKTMERYAGDLVQIGRQLGARP